MYERNRKTWFKHIDFMILDFIFVELSFILACIFRFGTGRIVSFMQSDKTENHYVHIMFVIAVLHIAIVLFTEPYANILKRGKLEEFKKVIRYCLYMFLGIVLLLFVKKTSETYSRIAVFIFPFISTFIIYIYRYYYKQYLRDRINSRENQSCLLLVGDTDRVRSTLKIIDKGAISTVRVVGIVLTDRASDAEVAATLEETGTDQVISLSAYKEEKFDPDIFKGIPIVGTMDNLYEYACSNVVDEVMLCMDNSMANDIARTFFDMGIVVHVSVHNLIQLPGAFVGRVNDVPVVTAGVNKVTSRQIIIKRLVDIFFGFFGSVVTLLLTIIIAPMIWIADPGPVFFRQERVGKNGRIFKIWKFRTMYKDAEARKAELMEQNKMSGLMFKMDDDPRIIGYGKKFSVGRFLRESSIDELPQSFNILMGEMSVVGTRPPTVKEYEQYDLRHKGRLATMPGLTGMWQVSGRSDITDFEEVVRLDKEYIENFSLSLDLKIIIKTFGVVLGKKGSV
ncbi:MAG: sugar transferase [Lachnospiraceae bacterium]|nr:sugar transferase [Lachnospiraceae bacterium]